MGFLKQQESITLNRLLTKENKLPFSLQKRNGILPIPFTVCSKKNGNCRFLFAQFSVYMYTVYICIEMAANTVLYINI
jgi:hypothetical protein